MTCLLGLNSLICAEEPSTIIYELDFNDCDSFKLQGAVMSVNPGNKTITVAEKEIRLMDVASNDQRLKTVLKQNAEPKSSGSLSAHNSAFRLGTSPLRSASLKAGL